jgi:glutaminyl-peptide cyclotransferase
MKTWAISFIMIWFLLPIVISCRNDATTEMDVPRIGYVCIKTYPHDTTSFTEGFLFDNGSLFESSGSFKNLAQTKSMFGIVDLKTGKIDIKAEVDKAKYCGEGIAFLNGKVYQLTYTNKVGFVYDALSFKKIKEFKIPCKEGWGLTTDGTSLIMSDGTNILTFLDPETFQVIKQIPVTAKKCRSNRLNLNELEYIKGSVFANIWPTSTIVKIDLTDGQIIGKMRLDSLSDDAFKIQKHIDVMNGIAYDSISDRIFITGKFWPKIYEIRLN